MWRHHAQKKPVLCHFVANFFLKNKEFSTEYSVFRKLCRHLAIFRQKEITEWRRKRKDSMQLSLPQKLMVFWVSPTALLNVNVIFCRFFFTHPVCDQTESSGVCLSYFMDNSIVSPKNGECDKLWNFLCTDYDTWSVMNREYKWPPCDLDTWITIL
jgi:hypothetical protein